MQRAVILAGPNGAGKSTVAEQLVFRTLGIENFVNADTLALGLARFNPWSARLRARTVQDGWLRDLAATDNDFAFETTLASQRWANLIREIQSDGYVVHLYFLWLPSAELCLERVVQRQAAGGHTVPGDVIRGRYTSGLRNLVSLYMPIVDRWMIFDGSRAARPIANGGKLIETFIHDADGFGKIESYRE